VGFKLRTSVVIGANCIGTCKSNYHTITTTTAPPLLIILWKITIQDIASFVLKNKFLAFESINLMACWTLAHNLDKTRYSLCLFLYKTVHYTYNVLDNKCLSNLCSSDLINLEGHELQFKSSHISIWHAHAKGVFSIFLSSLSWLFHSNTVIC
jgi:hypothetical protein